MSNSQEHRQEKEVASESSTERGRSESVQLTSQLGGAVIWESVQWLQRGGVEFICEFVQFSADELRQLKPENKELEDQNRLPELVWGQYS